MTNPRRLLRHIAPAFHAQALGRYADQDRYWDCMLENFRAAASELGCTLKPLPHTLAPYSAPDPDPVLLFALAARLLRARHLYLCPAAAPASAALAVAADLETEEALVWMRGLIDVVYAIGIELCGGDNTEDLLAADVESYAATTGGA